MRGVVAPPSGFVGQVALEGGEECAVEWDFAAFEPRPGSGGARGGDRVVDPAWGDGVAEFVVEDGAEGGDDLLRGG